MGRELKNLSFEGWLAYVFDHPVARSVGKAWHFKPNRDWWPEKPRPTLSYLTRLFEEPVSSTASYSDGQINQGLWFLADGSCSNHMHNLGDPHVPWAERKACIMAMSTLFQRLFATRCTPHLGHLGEEGNPLNGVCYMWWDIMPVMGYYWSQPEIDEAFIDVMEFTLHLNSDACRESALHGLCHWKHHYEQRTEAIFASFLENPPRLRPELLAYAQKAWHGGVQ